jgi:outer membrane biosynthesis protein TonB
MQVQFLRLFLVGFLFAAYTHNSASAQVTSWPGQLKALIFGGTEEKPQPQAEPRSPELNRASEEISTSQSQVTADTNDPAGAKQISTTSESAEAPNKPELARPENSELPSQASSHTKSSPQPASRPSKSKTASVQPIPSPKPAKTTSATSTSTTAKKTNSRFARNYQLCRKAYSEYSSVPSSAAKVKMLDENCKRWASNPDKETLAVYEGTYGQQSAKDRSATGFLHWMGERLRPITGAAQL